MRSEGCFEEVLQLSLSKDRIGVETKFFRGLLQDINKQTNKPNVSAFKPRYDLAKNHFVGADGHRFWSMAQVLTEGPRVWQTSISSGQAIYSDRRPEET